MSLMNDILWLNEVNRTMAESSREQKRVIGSTDKENMENKTQQVTLSDRQVIKAAQKLREEFSEHLWSMRCPESLSETAQVKIFIKMMRSAMEKGLKSG